MVTRTAGAPTRSTSSLTLTAGLMTIPVSVYTSVEPTKISRREFFRGDPNIAIGRVAIRRDNDTVVDPADVTRMAEADDGSWVVLTDDEINNCIGASGACEIVTFVPAADTGSYLTDGLYQVRPKADKKAGAATAAVFGLLLAGMAKRKVYALVRFALRGTPRYGLLSPEGDLFTVTTADAIREALPMPTVKPSKAELDMVVSLIDAIGVETPTLVDDTTPLVRQFVNAKAAAGGVMPVSDAPAPTGEVVDLMGVLQASIAQAKATKKAKVA